MRDIMSGFYVVLFLVYKSDFVDAWCCMIDKFRADDRFCYDTHKFMQLTRTTS